MLSLKKLTCHCGAVEIQVNINDDIDKLKRCNCSMCKRKGTMVATIEKKDLKVIKGENKIRIGYEPRASNSYHDVLHEDFRTAIESFCKEEEISIKKYLAACSEYTPIKKEYRI